MTDDKIRESLAFCEEVMKQCTNPTITVRVHEYAEVLRELQEARARIAELEMELQRRHPSDFTQDIDASMVEMKHD